MEQVSMRSDALIVLKDAFLRNAIEVFRAGGLRETLPVSNTAGPAAPASAGAARGPAPNERPA